MSGYPTQVHFPQLSLAVAEIPNQEPVYLLSTEELTVDPNRIEKPGDESLQDGDSTEQIRALIRNCRGVPVEVSEANFARVITRIIDKSLLNSFLSNYESINDNALGTVEKRRYDALSPYVGRTLVCVLIILPGVTYTFEIDLAGEYVIHWEWKAA